MGVSNVEQQVSMEKVRNVGSITRILSHVSDSYVLLVPEDYGSYQSCTQRATSGV